MKLSILKAKVKRNGLMSHAGTNYVDENSEIVKKLNEQGKKALLGIQNRKGIYTIIGEQFVYYLTSSGKRGEILHKEFIDELHENGSRIGTGYLKFKFLYKNIVLSNNDKVWLHNSDTMFSLWNTVLCVHRLQTKSE